MARKFQGAPPIHAAGPSCHGRAMKRQLMTRLLRMNVHMGRVGDGPVDARVIDLAQLANALDRKGETRSARPFSRGRLAAPAGAADHRRDAAAQAQEIRH